MNIEQAKKIPIEDFLLRLGYEPKRRMQRQLWYLSPLRQEKTPSFKVNPQMNAWYDFGLGKGGDIIDLMLQLAKLNSVSDALARISKIVGDDPVPRRPAAPAEPSATPPKIEVTSAGPVHSHSLLAYLRLRGIEPRNVSGCVQELQYRRGINHYSALAFANDSGGYEIRSPAFKGTVGPKDITSLPGDPQHVVLFEGFFDYLTAYVHRDDLPKATVIVLNSVAMREKAANAMRRLGPATIELFRDNDTAGEELLKYFRDALPESEIVDKSGCYEGYKDLNARHVDVERKKSLRLRA